MNFTIKNDKQFSFGKNWRRYLRLIDEERITYAEGSLKSMIEIQNLNGKTFLDIGSGSGLFSLAARRLGASVYSFDADPDSVACTRELKRLYMRDDNEWKIEQGSVLDKSYLNNLGSFDIVYAWGVLHHTGNMRQALKNVSLLVANGGKLYLSIYNDQDYKSTFNRFMKKTYVTSPKIIKAIILICYIAFETCKTILKNLILLGNPILQYKERKKSRGMSIMHDWIDWVGGYPFEVAKPEEIFLLFRNMNFVLLNLKTCGIGYGCNEYVFLKNKNIV